MPEAEHQVFGAYNLDFFLRTEAACQRVRDHVASSAGESSMKTLLRTVIHDLEFLHDLPLKTLNDHLKKYPFVDPKPFDELLAEMIDATLEWVVQVTKPYWVVTVLHHIGALDIRRRVLLSSAEVVEEEARKAATRAIADKHRPTTAERNRNGLAKPVSGIELDGASTAIDEEVELEQLGRFHYPVPLRLRDLQDLLRPFMEVRSTHYVPNLDAIMQELVRSLLKLFYSVRAWDDALVACIEAIAEASISASARERIHAVLELCGCLEMDSFEAAHRLGCVDGEIFIITPGEIEIICQRLPLYSDRRLLTGPPTMALEHGGLSSSAHGGTRQNGQGTPLHEAHGEGGTLMEVRKEVLQWWSDQNFSLAVPVTALSSALLSRLDMPFLARTLWYGMTFSLLLL